MTKNDYWAIQARYYIQWHGITLGSEIALQWLKNELMAGIHYQCQAESEKLDAKIKTIHKRSEQLYFEFCCSDGICCPNCGGTWNREAKTKYQDIYYCQLCFFEWPRTKKNHPIPLACHSSQNSKNPVIDVNLQNI